MHMAAAEHTDNRQSRVLTHTSSVARPVRFEIDAALPTSSCKISNMVSDQPTKGVAGLRPAPLSLLASCQKQGQHEAGRRLRLECLEPN